MATRIVSRDVEEIGGRYRIYGVIAAGGMARVHYGHLIGPAGFVRLVAIKRMHPQFCSGEFASLLVDEARLAAKIRHPNVVPVLEIVVDGGRPALVMEFVHGVPLSLLIQRLCLKHACIPPLIASTILAGVLHGLHAAHETRDENGNPLNLIHRDVSPQNVMVGADGVPRVLDFGIAKSSVRSPLLVTRYGQLKGKLGYFAPEQLACKPVDRRVDIFAAAIVLWESLTCSRLFAAESLEELFHVMTMRPLELPSSRTPQVSPALDAITVKGLASEPAQRFQTARDMALALERDVGIVSASQVSEYLRSIAGDVLEDSAARVSEIHKQLGRTVVRMGGEPISGLSATDLPVSGVVPNISRLGVVTDVPVSGVTPKTRVLTMRDPPEEEATSTVSAASHAKDIIPAPAAPPPRYSALAGIVALSIVATAALFIFANRSRAGANIAEQVSEARALLPSAAASHTASQLALPQTPNMPSNTAPAASVSPAPAVEPAHTSPSSNRSTNGESRQRPTPRSKQQRPEFRKSARPSVSTFSSRRTIGTRSCQPPYTMDARGIKRMKLECL